MTRSWAERFEAARDVFVPWIGHHIDLADARVVDFGCGSGSMALALAPHVSHLVCLDESEPSVDECRRRLDAAGHANVSTANGDFESLVASVERLSGSVDVFVLFAVLEHMTIAERLTTLAVAANVLGPGGVIVIAETPNRLLWNDYHTTETPFFGMLPDELAIELASSIRRTDVARSLQEPGEPYAERAYRLVRFGRGVSHHEFEAVFGRDVHGHVIASGWDPDLLADRPEYRDELYLSRFLSAADPAVSSCFSRYWLDLILKPGSLQRPAVPTPAALHTLGSRDAAITPWETAIVAPGGTLKVDLGGPSTRAVVNVVVGPDHPDQGPHLRVSAGDQTRSYRLAGHAPDHWVRQVDVDFAGPSDTIVVESLDSWLEVQSVTSWPETTPEQLAALAVRDVRHSTSSPVSTAT